MDCDVALGAREAAATTASPQTVSDNTREKVAPACWRMWRPDSQLLKQRGFARLEHIPCIFDQWASYHRQASRYLIDRGLGLWLGDPNATQRRRRRPSPRTIANIAHWLLNALEWADDRGIDLFSCRYEQDIVDGYQADMVRGEWSRDGRGLAASTVNVRADVLCDYVCWLVAKGYREAPFDVPRERVAVRVPNPVNAIGHRPVEVERRVGKVRVNKRHIQVPPDEEVRDWLERVYAREQYAIGLMCETILGTAVRLQEVASWRASYLADDRSSWHLNNRDASTFEQSVLVNIRFGAKGRFYGFDAYGDKIGPSGTIWVPHALAEKLHIYQRKRRNEALGKWVRAALTREEQDMRRSRNAHLFLDESGKGPITAKQLYRAWKRVPGPFRAWSPHLGRDWWCCAKLMQSTSTHLALLKDRSVEVRDLMHSLADIVIRYEIQPQLRHQDGRTTDGYLEWFMARINRPLGALYDAPVDKVVEGR